MSYERLPDHRMSYEDRLTEEAWTIASSRRSYEMGGVEWKPWMLNMVTVDVQDLISGKKTGLEIVIPDDQDYHWAGQRVDQERKNSDYYLRRLKRAKIIYCPLPLEDGYLHRINPCGISLYTSWNGLRDHLLVDHFFFLMGIPDEELRSVFNYTPENLRYLKYGDDFCGFTDGGRKKLAQLVGQPIAFVHFWGDNNQRRFFHSWNLSSKEIFYPS